MTLDSWAETILRTIWLRTRPLSKPTYLHIPCKLWYAENPLFCLSYSPDGHSIIFSKKTLFCIKDWNFYSEQYLDTAGMQIENSLYRIYLLSEIKVTTCRKEALTISYDNTELPEFSRFIDDISRQRQLG